MTINTFLSNIPIFHKIKIKDKYKISMDKQNNVIKCKIPP